MKNILFICASFAPENTIGCIRVTKFVKYLVRGGWNVTVISPPDSEYTHIDKTLNCEELSQIKRYYAPFNKLVLKLRHKNRTGQIGELKKGFKQKIINMAIGMFTFYKNYRWYFNIKKLVNRELNSTHFDYVFSSYPSLGAPLGAFYVKKKRLAEHWIADFRDPIAYDFYGDITNFFYNGLQKKFALNADIITTVTDGMMEKFNYNEETKSKLHHLSNGFDIDDLRYVDNIGIKDVIPVEGQADFKDKLIFAYTGILYYGKRDLSPLFKVCSNLIENREIDKSKLSFLYAGKDFSIIYNQAKKYDMQDCLVNYGIVDRTDAIAIKKKADITLVCTYNSTFDRGIVPGKFYECLMIGKPIISIVNGNAINSEVKKMTEHMAAGIVFEEAGKEKDFAVLQDGIKSLYEQKMKNGKVDIIMNEDIKTQYYYEKIVKRLEKLIEEL